MIWIQKWLGCSEAETYTSRNSSAWKLKSGLGTEHRDKRVQLSYGDHVRTIPGWNGEGGTNAKWLEGQLDASCKDTLKEGTKLCANPPMQLSSKFTFLSHLPGIHISHQLQ